MNVGIFWWVVRNDPASFNSKTHQFYDNTIISKLIAIPKF
jgi:hypothetical protein